ncbi:serine/threonine-protein kinase [Streptomyces sp. HUAS TT20]|uniref:serine/threonine-protein kinase n=1 Tax=Streptomyces sp. HUAS TT20 TaxID=3447509 RepID=UPI0021D8D751|nr:serine/threonine-protein kinase [Streptomyces sp. HUAS 15-9]UXY28598.1 protein kinase [Streptomyces sp. HUAS 15-9]
MAMFKALEPEDPRRVGRYRIVARLGAGGMGQVYLARSPGGRAVAVKTVRPELAGDGDFRRRFAREVAAARRVNGAFTAGVVDADADGSPPWLATVYVPGVPLGEAIARHGPWPTRPVLALGAGLAEALEAIHVVGIVHRDLKPSNVLLAADGPRVIDFGISAASEASVLTHTGMTMGTPGFMSPEQITGRPVGPASDVFSLGVLLAYTATRVGPFGAGTPHALHYRVVHEPPDLETLPPELREVVAACLAKQPGQRPTVAHLLDQLTTTDGADEASRTSTASLRLTEPGWMPAPVARFVRDHASTPIPHTLPPTPPNAGPAPPETPHRPLPGTPDASAPPWPPLPSSINLPHSSPPAAPAAPAAPGAHHTPVGPRQPRTLPPAPDTATPGPAERPAVGPAPQLLGHTPSPRSPGPPTAATAPTGLPPMPLAPPKPPNTAALAPAPAARHVRIRWNLKTVILLGVGFTVLVGGLIVCYQWTQTQYYIGANGDHVALYRGIDQDLAWVSLSKVEKDHPEIELRYLPPYQQNLVKNAIAEGDLPAAVSKVQELSVQASACKKEAERKKADHEYNAGTGDGEAGGATPTPTPGPSLSEDEQRVVSLCGSQ